jgi:transposase
VSIVGGLDIHRQQITFDYVDTVTGEVSAGRIPGAERRVLAAWLRRRFSDRQDLRDGGDGGDGSDGSDGGDGDRHDGGVEFALEGCTGWRYVAEELTAAGVVAHLADPAETANLRGRRKRAKTDRADARHQRDLLLQGRLPECWISPEQVLEARALLGCYQDLGRARLAQVTREQLSAAGQPSPLATERRYR